MNINLREYLYQIGNIIKNILTVMNMTTLDNYNNHNFTIF